MQINENDNNLIDEKINSYCDGRSLDGSDLTSIMKFAYELGVKSENRRIKEYLLKMTDMTEEKVIAEGKNVEEWKILFP